MAKGPVNPSPLRQRVPVFLTPDSSRVLFYEYVDGLNIALDGHPAYGTAHPNSDLFPSHELCLIKAADDEGLGFHYYYVDERSGEDSYNFEFTEADLGDQKFDAVRRTYVVKRSSFDPTSPAQGSVMPDVPSGKFPDYADYVLAKRRQVRTEVRELDSLYVVEQREYVRKVSIVAMDYDEPTDGVLGKTETLYVRGEDYDGYPIESQILEESVWGVSADGILTEARQLTANWFLVTSTDVVPQDKTTSGSKFGGVVLNSFVDYITYEWPAVLGDDGSKDALGNPVGDLGFEILDYVDKQGNSRDYVRPLYERAQYRGPTPAQITVEWVKVLPDILSSAERPETMVPLPLLYPSPYLVLRIPPTLHHEAWARCDTSATDPTWGENILSKRTFPATNYEDWPDTITADVRVEPFRGGYRITHVEAKKPEAGPIT